MMATLHELSQAIDIVDIIWLHRSSDLTAPYFFLWAFLNSKAHVDKPNAIK